MHRRAEGEELMAKTIVVVGFGPGISTAVAEKFGLAGFSVALVARNEQKLAEGVKALKARGIDALAVPADASDPTAIRAAIAKARALGPVTVLHWNAFDGAGPRDLMTADATALRGVFDVAVVGFLAAVQEALPDLKSTKEGAVLVTNGALGDINPLTNELGVRSKTVGVALANAAKHKLVGLLAYQLKGEGVYVGEVVVAGAIKGTPYAEGSALLRIDGATIANQFWKLYQGRGGLGARVTPLMRLGLAGLVCVVLLVAIIVALTLAVVR
jgi:NAD(P)-dependent dehydrogenase (short-subunit alcohol dehydrogenase family)